ncbi:hypothetical protein NYP80_18555 [Erwinia pyrifoliae]|uniref:hypothetical protein n=1 Tax=Erwinia pyrifoliae TaxID=79967 RepID=UPI0021BE7D8D|nr:hypothetical protein [Erwinia pyrifoliae]UXK12232.1 hypothetical protein NYP80_18555 [Erwinia pyrifoliae]
MNVTECDVKSLPQMFNKPSCPSNDSASPVIMNISTIDNISCTLIPAENTSIKQRECSGQKSGLLKDLTPQPITNKELLENKEPFGNIDILCEIYRKFPFDPEDIKSLTLICHDMNDYIFNSEKENIINGRVKHNTVAALNSCV